jgi:hypothetical protein
MVFFTLLLYGSLQLLIGAILIARYGRRSVRVRPRGTGGGNAG